MSLRKKTHDKMKIFRELKKIENAIFQFNDVLREHDLPEITFLHTLNHISIEDLDLLDYNYFIKNRVKRTIVQLSVSEIDYDVIQFTLKA